MTSSRHLTIGDRIPGETTLSCLDSDGLPHEHSCKALFEDQRVLIVSFPGAYTPTCSDRHIPGFDRLFFDFRARGINRIYAIGMNDPFVLDAWGRTLNCRNLTLLSDYDGTFTQGMGMMRYYERLHLGWRPRRYVALVSDSIIENLFIDSETEYQLHLYGGTDAQTVLSHL